MGFGVTNGFATLRARRRKTQKLTEHCNNKQEDYLCGVEGSKNKPSSPCIRLIALAKCDMIRYGRAIAQVSGLASV